VVLDADEWEHLPAEVYIPVHGLAPGSGDALVELCEMTDVRVALLVYSSVDLLLTCWGEHQSAMRLPVGRLPGLRRRLGFHAVLLDVSPLRRSQHDGERGTQAGSPGTCPAHRADA
jgi:hypothetical protein